jgi:HAD superfamily hydrolase (TIGR01509 family)
MELFPMPGAKELLSRLQIPFCIATNGPREKIELTLSLTGLRSFFGDRIFCAYDMGLFKPDPGLFLQAAAKLGTIPEHCAVVEDSLPGIQAGLSAGMQVFSLLNRQELPTEVSERITFITSLDELITRWSEVIS